MPDARIEIERLTKVYAKKRSPWQRPSGIRSAPEQVRR
jgi:hypothetical protein